MEAMATVAIRINRLFLPLALVYQRSDDQEHLHDSNSHLMLDGQHTQTHTHTDKTSVASFVCLHFDTQFFFFHLFIVGDFLQMLNVNVCKE